MHSRIFMMATTSDLSALLAEVEAQKPLKYTLTGFPDEPILQQLDSFRKIDGFGISKSGKMSLGRSFLISEPDLEIKIEPVPQCKGGIRYYIHTPLNPKTLFLCPGGMYLGNIVISSELLKYSDEPESKEIYRIFQREVQRQFTKHPSNPNWLGREASAIHAAGCRLTDDITSPFSLPLEKAQ